MSDAREKLFAYRRVYDIEGTEALFLSAARDNVALQSRRPFYSQWLKLNNFSLDFLAAPDDLPRIPPLPAIFFKINQFDENGEKAFLHATSSGTQGQRSQMDFDADTYRTGVRMAINVMRHFGFLSPIPARYVMLGFEPREGNEMGAIKTAMGVTRLAPALSRVFALRWNGNEYEPDRFGVLDALVRYQKQPFPVRFVGFPSHLYFLCMALKEAGLRLRMPRGSLALLGGGWKGFAGQAIPQEELRELARETLGLPGVRVRDFYSALEHPIAYAQCEKFHLHVPIHSRVYVRDPATLEPLPHGQPGLLSFVTPLVLSAPLVSVLMNDLAVMHPGEECGCGITSPFFEVLGRAGNIASRNCAISAAELLSGRGEAV